MSADTIKVLVVCDDEQKFILLRERFSRIEAAQYELEWQSSYDQALNGLADNRHDVCMVDYRLGAAGGVALIRAALERGSAVPMILLTGQGSHEVEMDAIGSGAMDFLTKQEIGGPLLERSLRYAAERAGRLNALRQSEARRQPAVDAGRVGVWDWNIQTGAIHIAPNLKSMPGYGEDEIGNRHEDWTQHIAPEDRERVAGEVRAVLRGGREELRVEFRMTCKDGSRRWFLSRGQAVRDKSGTVLRIMGTDTDITGRKQAGEAIDALHVNPERGFAGRGVVERNRELLETNKSLETAREQLAAALNSMSDAFVLYDARERLVVCNSKYRQLYPASAHLMVQGAKFEDIIRHVYESGVITGSGGEVEERARERLARFRNPGPPQEYELADGRWLLVEENRTAEGGVVGIRKDITERKRVEEELRCSEERLAKIVDTAVDGIITIDDEQTIQMFNRGAETIFGHTAEEIIGRPLAELIPTEFGDSHKGYVAAFGAGKDEPRNMKARGDVFGRRKNGEVFPAEASISKLVVRGARSYTVSIRDDTERKRAEEKPRANERLLQVVFDTIPAAVYVKDLEGRYIMANRTLCDYLGQKLEDLLSRRFADLGVGTAEEIKRAEQSDRRVLENGETIDIPEETLTYANGEVRWRHTHKAPLYDGPGNLVGLVGVREDITERKHAEQRLRQQRMQLIHADKMATLGVLVAGVAHEINNPNTAIMLNVPLLTSMWEDILPVLEQYDRENPNFTICNLPLEQARLEIPRLLAGISGGSQRVKHTVDNLKNFGRLNENREMNRISINDVVEFAVSLLKSQINKYTDRFFVKYGSRIPQFDEDFQEIEQVVINLINNACQALTDRNREVCVATVYDSKSRKIKVEVVDEGAGIAGEILDKIMDPFFTTKGDAGGTGLGLSVSYGILKEHRGSLEIASTVGSGTKATMILPPA